MTGTEKIIAHIQSDAKAQADEIIASAEKKCTEIRSRYEEQAAQIYSDTIRNGVQACQDQEDGALRISRMEARKAALTVKQEMVDRSFALAAEKICALPEEEYISFLAGLVRQASGTGDEEIILSAKDRAAIGEKLLQKVNQDGRNLTLSEETREITGGLVLRRGSIEVNCSVELLVELCKSDLSSALAGILFG